MRSKLLRIFLGLVIVLVVACGGLVLLAHPADEHSFFVQFERYPLVMAHQGGNGLWPDNTLYAFTRAVALGVDVLEMDVHGTADGELVVIHDDTVDRTTDGSGAVRELTLAEIKTLDAGYRWTDDDGQTFPYRGQGVTVPALAELFEAFPEMPMNIEIKQAEPPIAEPLCRQIRKAGMAERVLVASFHDEALDEFREACPEVATATGENEVIALFVLSKILFEGAYGPVATAVQVPEYRSGLHVLTPRFVDAAHRRNLQVHAWTINDKANMWRLTDLGVDGIITDRPDLLLEILDQLAIPWHHDQE